MEKTKKICPYSKKCGGCDFQGIEYEKQLEKIKRLVDLDTNDQLIELDLNYKKRCERKERLEELRKKREQFNETNEEFNQEQENNQLDEVISPYLRTQERRSKR